MSTHLGKQKQLPQEQSKLSVLLRALNQTQREKNFWIRVIDHGYLQRVISEEREAIAKREQYIDMLQKSHLRAPEELGIVESQLVSLQEQILEERQKIAVENFSGPREKKARSEKKDENLKLWNQLISKIMELRGVSRQDAEQMFPRPS